MALSSRATEIGRAIQAVAHERRDALRQQIAKLIAPAPRQLVDAIAAADTRGVDRRARLRALDGRSGVDRADGGANESAANSTAR